MYNHIVATNPVVYTIGTSRTAHHNFILWVFVAHITGSCTTFIAIPLERDTLQIEGSMKCETPPCDPAMVSFLNPEQSA